MLSSEEGLAPGAKLLTTSEAAAYLGITVRQMIRAVAQRRVRVVKLAGKHGPNHFAREDLDAWVAASTRDAIR